MAVEHNICLYEECKKFFKDYILSLFLSFSLSLVLPPLGFLSFLFYIVSSSLMPKMVSLVLQILILNANRMCQVQEDVNGKLIEKQRVDLCYVMSSACILKQKPAIELLTLRNPPTQAT